MLYPLTLTKTNPNTYWDPANPTETGNRYVDYYLLDQGGGILSSPVQTSYDLDTGGASTVYEVAGGTNQTQGDPILNDATTSGVTWFDYQFVFVTGVGDPCAGQTGSAVGEWHAKYTTANIATPSGSYASHCVRYSEGDIPTPNGSQNNENNAEIWCFSQNVGLVQLTFLHECENAQPGVAKNIWMSGTDITSTPAQCSPQNQPTLVVSLSNSKDYFLQGPTRGYAPGGGGTGAQHVFAVGMDERIHELFWNQSAWAPYDTLALAGAQISKVGSFVANYSGTPLTSYYYSPDGSEHVFYINKDSQVEGLKWQSSTSTWSRDAQPSMPTPATNSGITSLVSGTVQHVWYAGSDRHVHDLYSISGGAWATNDLTTATGDTARTASGTSTATLTSFLDGGNPRVFFIGSDSHIHEYWYDGSAWHANDPTAAAGAPNAASGSPLVSYITGTNIEHVFYVGTNQHIYEVWFNGSWRYTDDTAASGSETVASSSGLAGHLTSDSTEHIFYVGSSSGHLREIYWNGGWGMNDLTSATGGSVSPANNSQLTSYNYNREQHVFALGTDQHAHEFYYNGSSWTTNDITSYSGASPAANTASGAPLSGFIIP